jgi:hypothetical protein
VLHPHPQHGGIDAQQGGYACKACAPWFLDFALNSRRRRSQGFDAAREELPRCLRSIASRPTTECRICQCRGFIRRLIAC